MGYDQFIVVQYYDGDVMETSGHKTEQEALESISGSISDDLETGTALGENDTSYALFKRVRISVSAVATIAET